LLVPEETQAAAMGIVTLWIKRVRVSIASPLMQRQAPVGGSTTEAWPALHMGCHMRQQRGQPNRAH